MIKNISRLAFSLMVLLTMGCATTHDFKADSDLYSNYSCEELNKEISIVVGYHNEAVSDQGLSSKNAVTGLFFGGLAANISNEAAKSAERDAEAQKIFLYGIYDERNCADELYQLGKSSQQRSPQTVSQIPATTTPKDISPKLINGTGFLFSDTDYIITNYHLIKNANSIIAKFTNGESISATVATKDSKNDIAILKLHSSPNLSVTPIKIGNSSQAKMGQKIFTIGYPVSNIMGVKPKYSEGVINSMTGIRDDPTFFQISVPIQPGNSGGPLFNDKGEVIGITTSSMSTLSINAIGAIPQNVNYAIKSSFVKNILSTIPELMTSNTGIVIVPNELEKSLPNFIEQVSKNIILLEVKE